MQFQAPTNLLGLFIGDGMAYKSRPHDCLFIIQVAHPSGQSMILAEHFKKFKTPFSSSLNLLQCTASSKCYKSHIFFLQIKEGRAFFADTWRHT